MSDLDRLKKLSGIKERKKNIVQLNELNEAPKKAAPAAPAPGPSTGYDDSPLGALRQYDAAKAAGTLPPVTPAPGSASSGTTPSKVVPTKGGDYPVYPKSSPEASSFRDTFARERAAQGPGGTFQWQGRSYSTNRADDKPSTPQVRPISGVPSAGTGQPITPLNIGPSDSGRFGDNPARSPQSQMPVQPMARPSAPSVSSVPQAGAGMPATPSAIGPSTGPTSRFGDPSSAPQTQIPQAPLNRSGVAPTKTAPDLDFSNMKPAPMPVMPNTGTPGVKPAPMPVMPNTGTPGVKPVAMPIQQTTGNYDYKTSLPSAGTGMPEQPMKIGPSTGGSRFGNPTSPYNWSEEELEEENEEDMEEMAALADMFEAKMAELAKERGVVSEEEVTSVPKTRVDTNKDYSRYGPYAAAAKAVDQEKALDQDYGSDSNRIYWNTEIDKYRKGVQSGNIPAPTPKPPAPPNPLYDPDKAAAAKAALDKSREDKLAKQGLVRNPEYDLWVTANQPERGTFKSDPWNAPEKYIHQSQLPGAKTATTTEVPPDAIVVNPAQGGYKAPADQGAPDLKSNLDQWTQNKATLDQAQGAKAAFGGGLKEATMDNEIDKLKRMAGLSENYIYAAEEAEEEVEEAAKPDFLDVDKDGDKEEPMKNALKDKEQTDEGIRGLKRRDSGYKDNLKKFNSPSQSPKSFRQPGVPSKAEHSAELQALMAKYLDQGGQVNRVSEAAKPDFLDVDKDGNKKEPMKKALKDKEQTDEALDALKKAAGIW